MEAPSESERDAEGVRRNEPPHPNFGGRNSWENVNASSSGGAGRGGDEVVTFLIESAHDTALQDSPRTARERQIQRINTSRNRASWENRRATPNPNDQPFLATGDGQAQVRENGQTEPIRGIRSGAHETTDNDVARRTGAGVEAFRSGVTSSTQEQRGRADGRGRTPSPHAVSDTGRPAVDQGPAATLSENQRRPNDNIDAEHLASQLVQSRVEASRQRGVGAGAGGDGGSAAGQGGGALGGNASARHPGSGDGGLDTSSRRYRRWQLAARRKVEEALIFPRARMVAMDQGLAVYRIEVRRNGQLVSVRRVRSSGFSDLDAEGRRAIEVSAPFSPVPADIAPDQAVIRVDLTVAFQNPMI